MGPILDILKRLDPGFERTTIYRICEYAVLALLLYSMYADASGGLSAAKQNRDEQLKGFAVQLGQNHTDIYELKDETKRLGEWGKSLADRIKRLEDIELRKVK